MAEHTKLHLWLNTTIAALALVAAGASAYISWRTYEFKDKSIGFSPAAYYPDCRLEYVSVKEGHAIGLCWHVTISNESDTKISLVDHQAFMGEEPPSWRNPIVTEVEGDNGSVARFPIVLEGGAAQKYLLRVPLPLPAHTNSLVKDFWEQQRDSSPTLKALETFLFKHYTDFYGNVFEPKPGLQTWTLTVAQMKFTTGRGNIFTAQLFAPPFGAIVSGPDR